MRPDCPRKEFEFEARDLAASHASIERTDQDWPKMFLIAILTSREQAKLFIAGENAFTFSLVGNADQWVAAAHRIAQNPALALGDIQ